MTEMTFMELAEARDKAEEAHHKAFVASRTAAYELENKYEAKKKESLTDELTGLGNFRYFKDRLAEEFERSSRYEHPFSIVIGDLDNFKAWNTKHKYAGGNKALEYVGGVLRKTVRKTDIPCRYGGEEFVVILPDTPRKRFSDVIRMVDRIRKNIKQKNGELPERITMSFGIATYPGKNEIGPNTIISPEAMFDRANEALNYAKLMGKNAIAY
jgi:diguanylate cyclase (GGDEF)-like protein